MTEKLEAFRTKLEEQQLARLNSTGSALVVSNSPEHYRAAIKMGRKYANVDFGGSGKYMVVLDTGEIYGIKAYGVIHRGHYYGTLDTICDYDWSDYRATRRKVAA